MPLKAVALIHPGREFDVDPPPPDAARWVWEERDRIGVRQWNKEPCHKRKFLIAKGKYREVPKKYRELPNSPDKCGAITFWGEWEPRSRATRLVCRNNRSCLQPEFVHRPIPVLAGESPGGHNTDPFVFGDRFYYTNCSQTGIMRSLDNGSVILFGTPYPEREEFHVDTVVVVGGYVSPCEYLAVPGHLPQQLRLATLATLDLDGLAANNLGLRFYKGATPADGCPFSFVPCRPAPGDQPRGHARLRLCRREFGIRRMFAGHPFIKCVETQDQCSKFWWRVVKECKKQGLFLGHSIILPPSPDVERGADAHHKRAVSGCSAPDPPSAACPVRSSPRCRGRS